MALVQHLAASNLCGTLLCWGGGVQQEWTLSGQEAPRQPHPQQTLREGRSGAAG